MTDLANNLEVLSSEVDETLANGKTLNDVRIDREIEKELKYQKALRKEIKASQFTLPVPHESLRTDLDEDELLKLYEDHVGNVDSFSGKPTSPENAQWYLNPNHLSGYTDAPTLQSVGKTYRYGKKAKADYSDKDRVAHEHFPVTLSSSYELCALNYPASEPLNTSAPPSMRRSRSKSATRHHKFRTPDRYFNEEQDIDKMYLMTKEAPVIGKLNTQLKVVHP